MTTVERLRNIAYTLPYHNCLLPTAACPTLCTSHSAAHLAAHSPPRRRHKKDAADAARPVKAPSAAAPSISATASSELQERLRQRQNRLASSEEEQSKDQD